MPAPLHRGESPPVSEPSFVLPVRAKWCVSVQRDEATGELVVARKEWDEYGVRIVSRNTFPTAAGLASSAAGLACLSECCGGGGSLRLARGGGEAAMSDESQQTLPREGARRHPGFT